MGVEDGWTQRRRTTQKPPHPAVSPEETETVLLVTDGVAPEGEGSVRSWGFEGGSVCVR